MMRQNSLLVQGAFCLKISDDGHIFRSSGMTKAKDTSARRAPSRAGRSKLVISHNLRRLNVVSR